MKRKEKKMKGKLEMMQRETLRETNPRLQWPSNTFGEKTVETGDFG